MDEDDGVLDEQTRELTNGSRKALATFRRYENGWIVHLIEEKGWPDTGDNDSVFKTLDEAIAEAKRIWPVR